MKKNFVLGLDLGVNSLGWAMIEMEGDKPKSIINTGVRLFEAGLEDLELDGKGKSRNAARREARLRRRQTERKTRRLQKLLNFLIKNKFFDSEIILAPEKRHFFFEELDSNLKNPYELRKKALDDKLELRELGRIFYHLAQHRGFKSNKKTDKVKEKETSEMKLEIEGLRKEINDSGSRTLGEYFFKLTSEGNKIRGRHTDRRMYEEEFHKIVESQKKVHLNLFSDTFVNELYKMVFHQRGLKSQKHLIGKCSLEQGEKRAPVALLNAQRFRYLQKLNDLIIIDKKTGEVSNFSQEERQLLLDELENRKELTFAQIRKMFKHLKHSEFNLERGGEKKIPGNRTNAQLLEVFGNKWNEFDENKKNEVIESMRCIVKDDALERKGLKYGLSPEKAKEFSQVALEDGYISFSKKAIQKLYPLLLVGKQLSSTIKDIYPERFEKKVEPLTTLPPLNSDLLEEIRNPIVERSLGELRKVINAIIDKYGKPDSIKIELARELKQSKKQREEITKRNRENERERDAAKKVLVEECHLQNPSNEQIVKYLLLKECNYQCPYTGKIINMNDLFGEHPLFDIEHIIPYDRSLDDSFMNKTLCYAEENRNVKKNQTPYEAYQGNEKWEEMLQRVSKFQGRGAQEKLKRFKTTPEELEEIINEFSTRHLNDTRYASVYAKRYIGLLYGGVNEDGIDNTHKRRVEASSGKVTAHLRRALGLNTILSSGDFKSRDDHRHHAVDAIAIALTTANTIKELSNSAKRSDGKKLFAKYEVPWEIFRQEAEDKINDINISRRISKRIRGSLHNESLYAKPRRDQEGKTYIHFKTSIESLTEKEIDNILDERVKKIIKDELNKRDKSPKEAFKDKSNHPCIETKDGKKIPIHNVKVKRMFATYFEMGSEISKRYVQSSENHHIEIFEDLNTGKWDGKVISMYEAYRRKSNKENIINKKHGDNKKFIFSLHCGDIIELNEDNIKYLFVVRVIAGNNKQIRFSKIEDARLLKNIPATGNTALPDSLRQRGCRKLIVSPIGELQYSND